MQLWTRLLRLDGKQKRQMQENLNVRQTLRDWRI
jgi:hypothetical protein